MKKLTLKIKPKSELKEYLSHFFTQIESFEIIDMLKVDKQTLQETGIAKIILKPKYQKLSIENLILPPNIKQFQILNSNENKHTCFIKIQHQKKFQSLFQLFDFDLIWERPTIFTEKELILSCSSTNGNLKKLINTIKKFAEITNISYSELNYKENNFLSCLTEKQKLVFSLAYNNGYYKTPKQTSTEILAKELNCTKSAIIEHLRKSEQRIFDNLYKNNKNS